MLNSLIPILAQPIQTRHLAVFCTIVLLLFFTAAPSLGKTKAQKPTEHQALLGWARTHLVAQQMIMELPKYVDANKIDGVKLESFLSSQHGQLLWKKTVLARHFSALHSFNLMVADSDQSLISTSDKHLTKGDTETIRNNKSILDNPAATTLITAVSEAIKDETNRKHFALLVSPVRSDSLCTKAKSDLSAFRAFVKNIPASSLLNRPGKIQQHIRGWQAQRKQCLAYLLATSSDNDAPELTMAMLSAAVLFEQQAQDTMLLTMLATSMLQNANYAEALRAAHSLYGKDPAYRFVYNAIQRLFSYHQRGRGEVVIKSL